MCQGFCLKSNLVNCFFLIKGCIQMPYRRTDAFQMVDFL
ncbi:Uncharacterized protein dnl_05440 [Desulfonema limicola]|uniref:Uncharacterized protein n=1 Tax=Desulfonema limicola TaxID=45656 RepID=A0A975B3X7_9BACT|nr:Uncharacterized protein dnl_05440 [Desulfonema limicola]